MISSASALARALSMVHIFVIRRLDADRRHVILRVQLDPLLFDLHPHPVEVSLNGVGDHGVRGSVNYADGMHGSMSSMMLAPSSLSSVYQLSASSLSASRARSPCSMRSRRRARKVLS